jgi:LysR family glycine cleavage system transcriptional activator
MGQGNWEGVKAITFFPMSGQACTGYNDGVLPATPSDIAKSHLIFSMESWKTWCMNAGLEKEIVPGGER